MPDAKPKSKRIEFIDLLRGWAVIVMIETHVVNATLRNELMSGTFFEYLKFLNGLVAPSFLFASGLAYAVTTRRKIDQYLSFGPPLFRQLLRLLFILGLGYMLHLPQFNFGMLLHETTWEEWLVFFQVDVLHCIAVSLLALQLLLALVRSEALLYRILLPLTVGIIFITPIVWGVDFTGVVPAPLAAYLTGREYSLFPLFPWSAFLFAGALTGYWYLRARDGSPVHENGVLRIMKAVLWIAPALILASFLIEPLAGSFYPVYDYWRYSPSFVLLRLALVLLLCAGMYFYERRKGVAPGSVVTLIGRESLLVYVVHLLLIYGDFGAFNFQKSVAHSFGYGQAALVSLGLFLLMYVLARVWSGIKRGSPRAKRAAHIAVAVTLVAVFFFGPGQ